MCHRGYRPRCGEHADDPRRRPRTDALLRYVQHQMEHDARTGGANHKEGHQKQPEDRLPVGLAPHIRMRRPPASRRPPVGDASKSTKITVP